MYSWYQAPVFRSVKAELGQSVLPSQLRSVTVVLSSRVSPPRSVSVKVTVALWAFSFTRRVAITWPLAMVS